MLLLMSLSTSSISNRILCNIRLILDGHSDEIEMMEPRWCPWLQMCTELDSSNLIFGPFVMPSALDGWHKYLGGEKIQSFLPTLGRWCPEPSWNLEHHARHDGTLEQHPASDLLPPPFRCCIHLLLGLAVAMTMAATAASDFYCLVLLVNSSSAVQEQLRWATTLSDCEPFFRACSCDWVIVGKKETKQNNSWNLSHDGARPQKHFENRKLKP